MSKYPGFPDDVGTYKRLRHRVQIRKPLETPNSSGGKDITYEVIAEVWADIDPISVSSQTGAMIRDVQIENIPTHVITMRCSESLGINRHSLQAPLFLAMVKSDTEYRIFGIISVTDFRERSYLINILAKERAIHTLTDDLVR